MNSALDIPLPFENANPLLCYSRHPLRYSNTICRHILCENHALIWEDTWLQVSGPPPPPPLLSGPSTVRQLSSSRPAHYLWRWFLSVSGHYEGHFGNIYFKLVIITGICNFLTGNVCLLFDEQTNSLHPDLGEGYTQNPCSPIPAVERLTYRAHILPHMSPLLHQASPRAPAALQVWLRPHQDTGPPERGDTQSHHSEGQRSPKLPDRWLPWLWCISP